MIDNLLKHSIVITRKSINPTTRRDEQVAVGTFDCLIQAVGKQADVSIGNEIGKEYIIFFKDGTDIRAGDNGTYNSVKFSIDSIQERNSLFSSNKFYSVRATKMDTTKLYS